MATDALSIPFDITWQRLAWSVDMLDRSFGSGLPPKWRSSMAVYAYAVPMVETAEDYPGSRIVYLKLSASITGWSPRETIEGHLVPDPTWDPWQRAAWEAISASPSLARSYWPCVSAIAQVGVYPRPEAGVADDDYPYIVDFEPKKRELYESVTETGELLSGSSGNTNVRKGSTSTKSTEVSASMSAGVSGSGASAGVSASISHRWGREDVDVTTADASTERRETAGRSTQLSQMYQLFNGYHVGTNRSVFAIFPRPHTATEAGQADNNLINGERRLEGVQDVFLVVHVPAALPGICVRAFLDTGHRGYPGEDVPPQLVVTRRSVGGCAEFDGDRLRPVPPPIAPPRLPEIVGVHEVGGAHDNHRSRVASGRADRIAVADELNLALADTRTAMLADAATGSYAPRGFLQAETFRRIATVDLRRITAIGLADLTAAGYLSAAEESPLAALGMKTAGDLFAEPKIGTWPSLVGIVRARLLDGVVTAKPAG